MLPQFIGPDNVLRQTAAEHPIFIFRNYFMQSQMLPHIHIQVMMQTPVIIYFSKNSIQSIEY